MVTVMAHPAATTTAIFTQNRELSSIDIGDDDHRVHLLFATMDELRTWLLTTLGQVPT